MGKSRNKKARNRPTPIGNVDVKPRESDLDNGKMMSATESTINSLLEQVKL